MKSLSLHCCRAGFRRIVCGVALLAASAAAFAQVPSHVHSKVQPQVQSTEPKAETPVLMIADAAVLPHGAHGRGTDALLIRVWGTPAARVQVRTAGWPAMPLAETAPGEYQLVLQIEAAAGQLMPPIPTRWVIDLEQGGHTISALLEAVTPHGAKHARGAPPRIVRAAMVPVQGARHRLEVQGSPGGQVLVWLKGAQPLTLLLLQEQAPGRYSAEVPAGRWPLAIELEVRGRVVSRAFGARLGTRGTPTPPQLLAVEGGAQ